MGNTITLLHAFLGESLVTVAFIGLILAALAKDPAGSMGRGAVIVGRVLVVLLSLQWLLGIVNYFGLPAEARPSLAHPLLMTVLVAGFHVMMGRARKGPGLGRWGLAGLFAAALVLTLVGIQIV